jgi:aminocarboxymuconate-semialdehyde decarboxylase
VSGAVDLHGHYVSPRVLEALESEGALAQYGVAVERTVDGAPTLCIGGAAPTRPLLPALCDLRDRQSCLNAMGIGTQAIGTWLDVTAYALPAEQGAAWSRLLNESVARDMREVGEDVRFAGLATVPLQDGRLAAAELEYAVGTLGFRGAMVATNVNGGPLDAPGLEPFWAAAQAAHVPVVLHPYQVAGADRLREYFLFNLVGNPFDTTIAVASLIFGGVLDRFPDLELVLVHGGGCVPFLAGRLQRGYDARPEPKSRGAGAPLDYLRRFHYDTLVFLPPAVKYVVELVGADRVVLGSDYPFDVGDPEPLRVVREAGLDSDAVDQILVGNSLRLLGLSGSSPS